MAALVFGAEVAVDWVPSAVQRIYAASITAAAEAAVPLVFEASASASGELLAAAGPDLVVEGLDVVILDGSNSSGDPTSYTWTQVSGPIVTVQDALAPQASFEAPGLLAGATLVFQLVVNDGANDSAPDQVTVTVYPHVEWRNIAGTWVPLRTVLL